MRKKALVFLAPGFEEVEAVTPIDYLRRAGVKVSAVSIGTEKTVPGAHGIVITACAVIAELERSGGMDPAGWDAVFVPGGMPGAANLAACEGAGAFFKAMNGAGKLIAAICASPAVFLAPLGLLEGKRFTCYPGMEPAPLPPGAAWTEDPVVVDGNLVTSRGPGTAALFALALIEKLAGKAEADKLRAVALL